MDKRVSPMGGPLAGVNDAAKAVTYKNVIR
jgi:hypothetical protein